ncbi:hypothetical protein [Microcoleus sp. Pol17_C1]|uniref:hypothetical protein n=1 Tax=unclassified Microcoleus TaxID=2642155 RepID=UPI002FD191B6
MAVEFFRIRATNQLPNSHRLLRVSLWKTGRCRLYQIRLDRSGFCSPAVTIALRDDRSQLSEVRY